MSLYSTANCKETLSRAQKKNKQKRSELYAVTFTAIAGLTGLVPERVQYKCKYKARC